MKTFSYGITILTLIVSSVNGQGLDSIQHNNLSVKSQVLVEKLDADLNLTLDQKEQIRNVLGKRLESLSMGFNNTKLDKVNRAALQELKSILTIDQYQRYTMIRENIAKQRSGWARKNKKYKFTSEDQELDF